MSNEAGSVEQRFLSLQSATHAIPLREEKPPQEKSFFYRKKWHFCNLELPWGIVAEDANGSHATSLASVSLCLSE